MQLMLGDCLSLLPQIPDKCVDMIYADLPYGTTQCHWDCPIDLQRLWVQYKRIIKDRGAIVLHAQLPFDKILGASNLSWLRYEWIWEKGTATGFLNAKKMPMKSHESILVFYKNLPKYNPIKTKNHKPINAVYNKQKKTTDIYGDHVRLDSKKGSTERYPRSVLKFPVVTVGTLNPTQKPLALAEYLVKTYTDPGDLVIDNTMGSGTFGVACRNLFRRYVGMEKDVQQFNIAQKRIFCQ